MSNSSCVVMLPPTQRGPDKGHINRGKCPYWRSTAELGNYPHWYYAQSLWPSSCLEHTYFSKRARDMGGRGGVKERARAKERMREREGKKGSENLRGTETENERRKKTESERERKKGRERGEQ